MKAAMLAGLIVCAGGCVRFQPQPATNYKPSAIGQSVTLKDTSIHLDPNVLKPGTPRSAVQAAFGEPNATQTNAAGQPEDVYAFNPDGTKFVDPTIRPRNIALAVFSMGASVAIRQARLAMTERKLTIYDVTYGADDTIQSVRVQQPSAGGAPAPGATGGSSSPASQGAAGIE
ncbi:MAG TPA: hypothetical protein VFB33_04850 [Candidatus Binataceae bacterium]|nr:hypothetical protein [Candidatus Binataceae bacterium]